ncbi:acyl-CoA dehydrogenase, partial [Bacillus thuringiensis]|nr:acyl-CoA dehydrogenase [Bacillus thuringiensis]
IVPGTILRKSMKGELTLLQKTQKLQKELMMRMTEEVGEERFAHKKYLETNANKTGLMIAGKKDKKEGKAKDKEQEIMV